jgi:alcohol dehydrogenase
MGLVEEVGSDVNDMRKGDRVVVHFPIACGACFLPA